MGRRALLVIAAMLVAAFGVGLIFLYVNDAEKRANAGAQPVFILKAKDNLPRGANVDQLGGLVERVPVYASVAGLDPVRDLSEVRGKFLQVSVGKGLLLQRGMFGDQATVTNQAIAAGKLAITIPLSDPARVAGLLLPDSKVTIFRTAGKFPDRKTGVLLYDVRVISANGLSSGSSGKLAGSTAVPKTLVSLELTTDEAALVVQAANNGEVELWLGLQNSDEQPTLTAPITDARLLQEAK